MLSAHWTTDAASMILTSARDVKCHGPRAWFNATNHRGEACARLSPAPIQWGRGWYVVEVRGSLRPRTHLDPCPEADYLTCVVPTLTQARAVAVHRVFGEKGL